MPHFHWHRFQTEWKRHFSPRYFNGVKIGTLKCIFEETVPKLSVNFGNRNSQDSHKNRYLNPVLNFSFTAPQYSNKCDSLSQNEHKVAIAAFQNYYTFKFLIMKALKWYVGIAPCFVQQKSIFCVDFSLFSDMFNRLYLGLEKKRNLAVLAEILGF